MRLQDKLLEQYNINVMHLDYGSHKNKCPPCQPPHDSKDRPLSVEITASSLLFFCHHCEYKGGVFEEKLGE